MLPGLVASPPFGGGSPGRRRGHRPPDGDRPAQFSNSQELENNKFLPSYSQILKNIRIDRAGAPFASHEASPC